jgi:hypothetical protein
VATQTRNPTSDEAVTGTWSGSVGSRWTLVDDYPSVATNDLLTGGTTAAVITFGFSAFTIPTGSTGISVQVQYFDGEAANGANNCGARIKVGGSYFNAASHNPSGTAGTSREDSWATNPKTAAAWTVDDVNGVGANALQAFGMNSTDSNPTWRFSSVQVQVTYTPPVERTGSGSGDSGAQIGTGTGAAVVGGSGSGSASVQTGSGSGTVESANPDRTGSGAGVSAAQAGTGSGGVAIGCGGTGTASAQTGTGGASSIASGSGADTSSAQTGAGTGTATVSGTGTSSNSAQTADGDAAAVVSGVGGGTVIAQTGAGTGGGAQQLDARTGSGAGTTIAQAGAGVGAVAVAGAGASSASAQTGQGSGGHDETPDVSHVTPRRRATSLSRITRVSGGFGRPTRIRRTRD